MCRDWHWPCDTSRSQVQQHCNRSIVECFFPPIAPEMHLSYGRFAHRVRKTKRGGMMPDEETMEHAQEDLREGKSPSTAAGEFVREEMDHIREGKHGARSTKQAIAIGLSKARRAGIPLKPPAAGKASAKTRKSAASA